MTPGQLSPVHISNILPLPHRYTISPEEIRYNQAALQKKLPASPCPARRYNTRFPVPLYNTSKISWFHSTMILHYSQTFSNAYRNIFLFHSTMILHYSQTKFSRFMKENKFHSTMILHYSQTIAQFDKMLDSFHSTMILHYSQTNVILLW